MRWKPAQNARKSGLIASATQVNSGVRILSELVSRILVINPNSSTTVTAALDRGLDPLRCAGGPRIETTTLSEGPPGIETQAQVDAAGAHVSAAIAREPADAYVIACFSDPGLHAARSRSQVPVFGIAESACAFAITLGER